MSSYEDNSEFLSEIRLKKIAKVNADLLCKGAYWIHRRNENVAIMDDTAVQRTVSVDFTLPEEIDGKRFDAIVQLPDGGEPVFCPPLFLLRKASKELMAFELKSESGVRLPLMTRRDNARISGATLVALGERIIDEKLSETLINRLEKLATANTVRPVAAERLKQADKDDADFEQVHGLLESPVFEKWLWTLAHSSLVGVPYRDPTVRRKIFVLSYIESFERTLHVRTRLGWTAYKAVIESPWTGARNFHFEVEAPPGLRIAKAVLGEDGGKERSKSQASGERKANQDSGLRSGGPTAAARESLSEKDPASGKFSTVGTVTSRSGQPPTDGLAREEVSTADAALSRGSGGNEEAPDDPQGVLRGHNGEADSRLDVELNGFNGDGSENLRRVDADHEAEGELRRVHLSRYEAAYAGTDTATLDLRVSGPGFVGGALPACALVVGALLGCLIQVHTVARFPTSAPAGLLVLPGIIATYVGRPDGHALTTRLLLFARWLLLLAALAAYGCAAVLGLGEAPKTGVPATQRVGELEIAFWVGLGLALIAFTGLAVGRLLANQWVRGLLGQLISLQWTTRSWKMLKRAYFSHSIALPVSKERLQKELAEHAHSLLSRGKHEEIEDGGFELRGRTSTWKTRLDVVEVDEEVELSVHGVCLPRLLLLPIRPVLVMRQAWAARRRLERYRESLRPK